MIRNITKNYRCFAVLSILMCLFWHCSIPFQIVPNSPARIETKTSVNKQLTSLPAAKEKITATVYKFRDQSGQYKATENGTSWSTAITQGATSILIKALEESNWFVIIEREGLSNLLNERKIIRSSKANYQNQSEQENQLIPPLLYAGIILEGGIISYDSNIRTGGIGLKYFGAGASNEYREDRISVYLRAVATQNGRVLTTVYTSKTILSQMIDIGFYRYVNFKKLLEAEAGYSYNEPTEICVKEAIEKAVVSLIMEGLLHNLWATADSNAINSKAVIDYLKEKEESKSVDVYDREFSNKSSIEFGLKSGLQLYSGDYSSSDLKSAFQFNISFPLQDELDISLGLGQGIISSKKYFSSTVRSVELNLKYKFLPEYKYSPYFILGAGAGWYKLEEKFGNHLESKSHIIPQILAGVGFEYRVFRKVGLSILVDHHYYFDDKLDGVESGKFNDFYWRAMFGVSFYF